MVLKGVNVTVVLSGTSVKQIWYTVATITATTSCDVYALVCYTATTTVVVNSSRYHGE